MLFVLINAYCEIALGTHKRGATILKSSASRSSLAQLKFLSKEGTMHHVCIASRAAQRVATDRRPQEGIWRKLLTTLAGMTILAALAVPTGAVAALPTSPGGPIDAYAAYEGQSTCDPTPKPGVVGFRDILLVDYPGRSLGISRDCSVGGQSEHKEGRALDFAFNAYDSTQAAQAASVLNWLLATDAVGNRHALLRRFGVMYIIWNQRIFSASDPGAGWQPYSGASPHTDHIHFSFSWSGALKTTSWWAPAGRWLTPGTADERFHCSGYNNELSPLVFQDCVVVTDAAAGAHAQSVMAVSNPGSTAVRVNGQTTTYLDGGVLIGGACGDIVIAAGGRSWCWGTSSAVAGNGRYVQGQGALRFPGGYWHLAWSPSVRT